MALTRKMLKAMGIADEIIDQIIDAHTETVDALKEERDNLKKDADQLKGVQKELADAKELLEKEEKDPYKVKYEAIKEDFDKYKADIEEKTIKANKSSAYEALLKEIGISDKRISAVMKISDVNSIELDDKGNIVGKNKLADDLKKEWSDFIVSESKKGADESNPPSHHGDEKDYDSMSDAEYYKATYEASKKK